MEYVMVPVPEELVDEVKDYLNWQLSAPQTPDNPEAVRAVLEGVDDTLRRIVYTTAEATSEQIRPTLTDIAARAGINIREFIGAVADLNSRLRAEGRSAPLLMVRPDPRPRDDDTPEWEHRIVHMLEVDANELLDG